MSEVRQINCGQCQKPLPSVGFNTGELAGCPICGTLAEVEIFPAFFQEHFTATGGETLLVDAETSCFYHPQKKAAVVCDTCGRFLCGLCDVNLNGQHLCPACVDTGRKKKKIRNLENERTLYDSMTLLLAIAPLLFWPLTIITAPAAIYVAARYWNAPGSLIARSKFRFVLGALIALAQIAGWLFVVFYFVTR